jgi:hypothetical protein
MGLPCAEPAGLAVQWDADAPMPVLIAALLTFVASYLRDSEDDHGIGAGALARMRSDMSIVAGLPPAGR